MTDFKPGSLRAEIAELVMYGLSNAEIRAEVCPKVLPASISEAIRHVRRKLKIAEPEGAVRYVRQIPRPVKARVPVATEAACPVAEIRRLLDMRVPITAIAAKLHVPYRDVIAVVDAR